MVGGFAGMTGLVGAAAAGGDGALAAGTVAGPWWVVLIPLLPMAGVVLTLVCAIFDVRTKAPAWMSVGCLAASFGLAVLAYLELAGGPTAVTVGFRWIDVAWGDGPGQRLSADFAFAFDGLTCLWMLFVTGLATLIALYASEYMSHDVGVGYCRFFAAFNLFVFSMACLVMADNLLLLFLGWEGVGLCSYLLIGYFYKKPSAVAAAKKAFIVNRIGDLGLLMGMLLTFVQFGTLKYSELWPLVEPFVAAVRSGHADEVPFLVGLIPVLFMVGAFGKSAQLPLYVWLPDAMEGPTPVSALIHAATMVTAGVYLVARTYPLFLVSEWALPVVAWVGALTALLAATIGMAQFDIKRIMAYSTVSQLGYMFCGMALLTSVGGAFHVFTHAFFKATLFLCCGAVMHGFAGQLDLRRLSGVGLMPGWRIVGLAMLVGCLNLAGFPFTAGFFSKDMILAEAFVTAGPGYTAIGWILLLTAGLTAYYTFRVFFRVFVGPVEYEPGDEHHGDAQGHHHEEHGAEEGGLKGPAPEAGEGKAGHGFHPHAPGWAINLVLALLAAGSIAAAGAYFVHTEHHGWVGNLLHGSPAEPTHSAAFVDAHGHGGGDAGAHGSFFGLDPHKAMYFVSSAIGLAGIGVAFGLHYLGRTGAARSRADALLPKVGPVAKWAQGKWYVDELYDAVIVKPLWVLSHVLHMIDKLVVDGLVNAAGWLPRMIGRAVRPSQGGVLHGYAVQMAGGIAVALIVVWLMTL
ncbi:MAG: NADH-quinone oxidoreductase subunit L [Phycisphaeraceae bacterium]|nr:NADH-quinone oxidoreductase subunit L [Phycisphaeraceae bacterium]